MIIQKHFMDRPMSNINRGFTLLVAVIMVSVIGTAIGISLILLGLGSGRSSLVLTQSYQAKALSNACEEEALQQISDHTPFTGSGGLTIGSGSCTYTVTSQGGSNRTVTTVGTVQTVKRKSRIVITKIKPSFMFSSWQETP